MRKVVMVMRKVVMVILMIAGFMSVLSAGFMSEIHGDLERVEMFKFSGEFRLKPKKVKTVYTHRIVWGSEWSDRKVGDPAIGIGVTVFGEGWEYTTITDNNGTFIVPVKANVPFMIKASGGHFWAEYNKTLAPIPKGATGTGK